MGNLTTIEVKDSRTENLEEATEGRVRIFIGPRSSLKSDLRSSFGVYIGAAYEAGSTMYCTDISVDFYGMEDDGTITQEATCTFSEIDREGTTPDDNGKMRGQEGYVKKTFTFGLEQVEVNTTLVEKGKKAKAIERWKFDKKAGAKGSMVRVPAKISVSKPTVQLKVSSTVKRVNWVNIAKFIGYVSSEDVLSHKKGQWKFEGGTLDESKPGVVTVDMGFDLNIPGWNINNFGEPESVVMNGETYDLKTAKNVKGDCRDFKVYKSTNFHTLFGKLLKGIA